MYLRVLCLKRINIFAKMLNLLVLRMKVKSSDQMKDLHKSVSMLLTCMSPMINDAGTQNFKGGIKRMEYINIKSFSK